MKIAVYSGSFNPLHKGHLEIMKNLTESEKFDRIYLVVSPQNPLKEAENNLSAKKRLSDAIAAVNRHPELKVTVEDIELGMEPPHYTIRTLDALKSREPDNDFTLVIGADNLSNIHKWKDFERILSEYGVIVFPRDGHDLALLKSNLHKEEGGDKFRIDIIDAPEINISSTKIREALARGLDVSEYLM